MIKLELNIKEWINIKLNLYKRLKIRTIVSNLIENVLQNYTSISITLTRTENTKWSIVIKTIAERGLRWSVLEVLGKVKL